MGYRVSHKNNPPPDTSERGCMHAVPAPVMCKSRTRRGGFLVARDRQFFAAHTADSLGGRKERRRRRRMRGIASLEEEEGGRERERNGKRDNRRGGGEEKAHI